ncbi:MAG: anthranilate phosphoribosyltransferase [Candidatus Levybacteria bacterium]|nr:anthranilate phosphoribosyltransferase [Candidatus Levybacteria bacterium]
MLNKLINKQDLTQREAEELLVRFMNGEITSVQAAAVLTAMRMKGESVSEITGFINIMRKKMLKIKAPKNAIDVCGTGGDSSNTFNISTTVAIVVAAAGVPVVKHGNRKTSSLSGSADVLEALGVHIQLTPEQTENVLKKVGMVFLFAPLFHPSMKQVAVLRQELKIRTVFNFLGPYANPAGVKRQLIGVPNITIAKKMAEVGKRLGYKHLAIITSTEGMDEVSINAKTHLFEIKGRSLTKKIIDPQKLGFKKTFRKDFFGGDAAVNAEIIKEILDGKKGPKRDIVVLNSAVALIVAGKVENIREGILLASKSIDSGVANKILENLIKETQKI